MVVEGIIIGAFCAVIITTIPILWWRSHLKKVYQRMYILQPNFEMLVNDFVETEEYRKLATFAILNGASVTINKDGNVTYRIEKPKTIRGEQML